MYIYFSIYCQFVTIFIFLSKIGINKGRTEYTLKKVKGAHTVVKMLSICKKEYKILCKLLVFVAAGTNMMLSDSLITLTEADDYSQIKFGDSITSEKFKLKAPRFSPQCVSVCGNTITVIGTLVADRATCLLLSSSLLLFQFPFLLLLLSVLVCDQV